MKINNFQIMVGNEACNAGCKFCISRSTYKITDNYPARLEKAKLLGKRLNITTAIITGKGEPTLISSEKLRNIISDLSNSFPVIELKTNALVLTVKDLLEYYYNGLTTVAISRVHYDDKKNNEAMQIKKNQDLTRFKNVTVPICKRLVITMCKGYIDSSKEVAKVIEYVKKIGFHQLTLYPVGKPQFCHNSKIEKWIEKHSLDINQLQGAEHYLETRGNLITAFDWGGKMFDIDGITILIGSCLDDDKNRQSGNFHSLILGTDGHVRLSWEYKGSMIF